ncbi:RNA-guided endonuclease TnpB family protein [Bosea sp. ANAM02]|uniref:RNA-guided endonuclease InsQ/TnpB family protein n=1 Tax=Bosea sp. ANAM02 TaxID=2020412 RepID=UPI00140ED88D|nr:RNA-guided endonuclease TnpB family protein [Bosea sp. ANAM02]BCB21970.1 transposase [Bosea sp. ANAM02]
MLRQQAYRFRIYPGDDQVDLFRRTIGCCRLVYNLCLDQKTLEQHRSAPRRLSYSEQCDGLTELKREVEWLRDVPHHPLQQAIRDLHRAFTNFFEGRARYPSFRRKGQNEAFRYPDPKQVKLEKQRIFLPKAGWVEIVQHRPVKGEIRNVTVSVIAGDWFVSIQVEQEVAEAPANQGPAVGVDLGVEQPITLSDGTIFQLPRVTPHERRRLASAQQSMARRRKGSRNRAKARRRVARLQAKFARRRRDAAHKATTIIAKSHGTIVVEDLKVRKMTASARGTAGEPGSKVRQKAGLNRSMLDIAPGMIRSMLAYKASWYGSRLIAVDPAYTSQECSSCRTVDAKSRISRSQFVCTNCGLIENADVNAARSILARGLGSTGGLPGMACGSSRAGGRNQELTPAKARSSVLQGRE